MTTTIKRINAREFQSFGYLQEVNRQFLHPLGLALEIIIDDETGDVSLGGIWDYRDDPAGLVFDKDEIDPEKAARVQVAWCRNEKTRTDRLGYIIQPIA